MPQQPAPYLPNNDHQVSSSHRAVTIRFRQFSRALGKFALLCLSLAMLLFASMLLGSQSGTIYWASLSQVTTLFVALLTGGFTALLLARINSLGVGWLGLVLGILATHALLLYALLGSRLGFATDIPLLVDFFTALRGPGWYLTIISVVQITAANVWYIHKNQQRNYQRLVNDDEKKPGYREPKTFIPPCWELSGCPEAVQSRCPNNIDKIPCWKRRVGCLCDSSLAAYLYQHARTVSEDSSNQLEIFDLTFIPELATYPTRLRNMPPRSWRERKEFCHRCAIYLEHQGYKYRRLNWIFFPITLGLVAVLLPGYHRAYEWGARYLDGLTVQLTSAGYMPAGSYADAGGLIGNPYEYVLLVVLSLLLISYIIEFTDRCLLEWKW